MIKEHISKIVLCIVAGAMMLSGCNEVVEVPKLKEPKAVNQAFRPVEKRTIGKIKVSVGNVVAKEYCHSYKKVTTIKEIYCNVGDHVEAGQVLAVSDAKALREELEDISDQRTLLTALYEARQPLYGLNIDLIEVDRKSAANVEDYKTNAYLLNEINLEKEDQVYDQESGVRSQESGIRSQESGVRSQESGVRD